MRAIGPKELEELLLETSDPLIVLFESTRCPFCTDFRRRMEKSENGLPWPVVTVSLDDWSSPLWDVYSVEVVPTLIVFHKGEPVFRIDGILGVGLSDKDIGRLKECSTSVC